MIFSFTLSFEYYFHIKRKTYLNIKYNSICYANTNNCFKDIVKSYRKGDPFD